MEKLFEILYKYQWEYIKLKKDADNPFFKSKYVTLDNILDHYIPKLNEDWILCMHHVQDKELITTLIHIESWDKIMSNFPLNNTDPQKQWSEISYWKRYNLWCILNIQTDTDDDWNKASSWWNTKEFYKWWIDMMDWVQRVKDEQDINHLDTIYKEFMKLKPSKKQIDWLVKECWNRKDYLLDNQ